jgi:hypothetical protein
VYQTLYGTAAYIIPFDSKKQQTLLFSIAMHTHFVRRKLKVQAFERHMIDPVRRNQKLSIKS